MEADVSNAFEPLNVSRHLQSLHIELNRPERLNALSKRVLLELGAWLAAAETDPQVGAVMISGPGKAGARLESGPRVAGCAS